MQDLSIAPIVNAYFPNAPKFIANPVGSGHIHKTYVLKVSGRTEKFILQQINTGVFNDPNQLITNHNRLYRIFEQQVEPPFDIPALLLTIDSDDPYLYTDDQGEVWRLMEHIPGSYSIDQLESVDMAREAGKAFGWFIQLTTGLSGESFTLPIPRFHDLAFRLEQLYEAISSDKAGRKKSSQPLIDFFYDRQSVFEDLQNKITSGTIPQRITHNDTKINNVLFRRKQAVAVIDLDTVGPGVIHYDYGDSLRTITNFAVEDEQDLEKVAFNQDAFIAYTQGFLAKTAGLLQEAEHESLYLAPRLMTYIMGIRFLTDYLNGDSYYATKYPEHNFVRSQVQKTLLQSMEDAETFMQTTIQSIYQ